MFNLVGTAASEGVDEIKFVAVTQVAADPPIPDLNSQS